MKKKFLTAALVGYAACSLSGCTTASINQPAANLSEKTAPALIKMGGSSETYEVLEQLAEAYSQQKGADNITFEFFPPSQTSGGIQGVKNSLIDIGGVSNKPASEETDESLTYLPLAETPLVMVVHESVSGVSNITAEQIKAIYAGTITNWKELGGPDAAIALFDLTEDENEKQLLRETYLGSDLTISPEAIVFAEDDELIETAAATNFSIAAVPLEDELTDLPINVLSIDGVIPSPTTLASGEYAMGLPLGVVFATAPSVETQDFITFITSEQGQTVLEDSADD